MQKMTEEEYSLAQHLRELGCPLEVSDGYRDAPAGLKLRQVPTSANQLFDLDEGGAGLVMDMRISSDLNLPIRSRQVRVKAPWGFLRISLLPDPSKRSRKLQCYEFPGSGLSFDRSVVLNDFLSGNATLNPGDEIQGLLLAVDEKPIPNQYPEHGRTIVQLSVFDQRGNEFTSEFHLCVDRSAACHRDRLRKIAASSKSMRRSKKLVIAAA